MKILLSAYVTKDIYNHHGPENRVVFDHKEESYEEKEVPPDYASFVRRGWHNKVDINFTNRRNNVYNRGSL